MSNTEKDAANWIAAVALKRVILSGKMSGGDMPKIGRRTTNIGASGVPQTKSGCLSWTAKAPAAATGKAPTTIGKCIMNITGGAGLKTQRMYTH